MGSRQAPCNDDLPSWRLLAPRYRPAPDSLLAPKLYFWLTSFYAVTFQLSLVYVLIAGASTYVSPHHPTTNVTSVRPQGLLSSFKFKNLNNSFGSRVSPYILRSVSTPTTLFHSLTLKYSNSLLNLHLAPKSLLRKFCERLTKGAGKISSASWFYAPKLTSCLRSSARATALSTSSLRHVFYEDKV